MDFAEAKQKKERGYTVKEMLESALGGVDEIETIVISTMSKDGFVSTSYSWDNAANAVGMVEISKAQILDGIRN